MIIMDTNEKWKTHAVILRCSDRTFLSLLNLMRGTHDLALIYTRSSDQKLIITEEAR
jgi:hypothetical protein